MQKKIFQLVIFVTIWQIINKSLRLPFSEILFFMCVHNETVLVKSFLLEIIKHVIMFSENFGLYILLHFLRTQVNSFCCSNPYLLNWKMSQNIGFIFNIAISAAKLYGCVAILLWRKPHTLVHGWNLQRNRTFSSFLN